MAYSLSNKCAENLCKRTALVQLIFENAVTCFLRHGMVWLPEGENSLRIRLAVSTQYRRVTDR